jgi:uncharacterized protein (UPF0276 family)
MQSEGFPQAGLALMVEADFAQAAYPLFAAGEVEVLEWSFDVLWKGAVAPDWVSPLIDEFAKASRLLGHGVSYSMFTFGQDDRSSNWCARLQEECSTLSYRHITEHFGFMVAGDFHKGAPLPVPFTPELLELGKDRLKKLSDAARVPVGLENLAFAFGLEDVRRQGAFIDALITPIEGFVLLDLHNIHCQACNFDIAPEELLQAYPLSKVRELHLSGGSWSEAAGEKIRRDTHDGPVPEELFPLLRHALEVCPNVETVILEQLGNALPDELSHNQYRADFRRMTALVKEFRDG